MRAVVVFSCLDPDCQQSISFNVMDLRASKGRISCQTCHRPYHFDTAFLDKLERLRNLIFAVQAAEDILADSSVAVTTPMGEVKVPYSLLLTRLNTTITLTVGEHRVDFCFRVEPLNDGSFT
jgi:hypothetical protein